MASKGPVMYAMKPVFELKTEEIVLPTNMYKLQNIHNASFTNFVEGKDTNGDLDLIEKRQENLLQKLAEIKELLAALKNEVAAPKINSTRKETATKMHGKPNFSDFGITYDVVLNLSIQGRPPYSLLALNKIWPDFCVRYSWHLHSSASSLPPEFERFQKQLEKQSFNGQADLNIRIVYKNVDTQCEFIISPIRSVPLMGEVSLLRFLNYSLSNDSDVIEQTLMEEKLDVCYSLAQCIKNDELKPYLQTLCIGLNQHKWLCGDSISVVDIAAWSVFKQMRKNDLGMQALNTWFKNSNEYFNA